ncbi:MAG TPA: IS200/IS605 family transposase [Phycisphaerae bacterium]|nr:IS200/IS605 family transposase [Phycisphaerae bacterium]
MSQTLVKLYVHVVFSTKHREPMIVPEVEQKLHAYMTGIVKGNGCKLVRIGGMPDHVHLLVLLSKNLALADFLQVTKKESSKWIKTQYPSLDQFRWQDGYAGFSVSESAVDTCIRYIDNQKEHHAKLTFQQELLMLLQKHNVEYDERYMWD